MAKIRVIEENINRNVTKVSFNRILKPKIIGITEDWIIVHAFNDAHVDELYTYNLMNRTWKKLRHEKFPEFSEHRTMLLMHDEFLVVHGTNDKYRRVYHTFVANLKKRPTVKFNFFTKLETYSVYYGEHRLINDNVNLYVLSGYDITRPNNTTVHRLNLEEGHWQELYKAPLASERGDYYDLPDERSIIYNDCKIFVFSNNQGQYHNFATSFTNLLPQCVSVFDMHQHVWRQYAIPMSRIKWTIAYPSPRLTERSDPYLSELDGYSLSQCPIVPKRVYFTFANASLSTGPEWDTWLFDLKTCRWTRLQVHNEFETRLWPMILSTAFTPSGRMYAVGIKESGDNKFRVFSGRIESSSRVRAVVSCADRKVRASRTIEFVDR